VIFLPYDIESYERGLPYQYHEITPGPKPENQAGFIRHLQRAIHREDSYTEDRKRVRNKFFSHTDGKSTERVIRLLEKLSGAATS
jgi:CDP-glycerol glycerophosphotransferase